MKEGGGQAAAFLCYILLHGLYFTFKLATKVLSLRTLLHWHAFTFCFSNSSIDYLKYRIIHHWAIWIFIPVIVWLLLQSYWLLIWGPLNHSYKIGKVSDVHGILLMSAKTDDLYLFLYCTEFSFISSEIHIPKDLSINLLFYGGMLLICLCYSHHLHYM